MEAALAQPMYHPITTNFVRSVDRISHKLLLEFTLGLDANIISMKHDYKEDEIDLDKAIDIIDQNEKIIDLDDADGLTDVLNDFEELRDSLNDQDDLNFNEFNDISNVNDFPEKSFNVDGFLNEKEINNDFDELIRKGFSEKSIDNEIEDIINAEFKKNESMAVKTIDDGTNLTAAKHVINEDTTNSFNNPEELLNANINDSLPEVINLNDVSINTNDLNENENSNLEDTFNNFILDHGYMHENLIDGNAVLGKKEVTKNIHEEMLKNIIPTICKPSNNVLGKTVLKKLPITGEKEINIGKESQLTEIPSMGKEIINIGEKALVKEIITKVSENDKNVDEESLINPTSEKETVDVESLLKDNPTIKKKKAVKTFHKVIKPKPLKNYKIPFLKNNHSFKPKKHVARKPSKKIQTEPTVLTDDELDTDIKKPENNKIKWQKGAEYNNGDTGVDERESDDELALSKLKLTKYKPQQDKDTFDTKRQTKKTDDETDVSENNNVKWKRGVIKYKKRGEDKSNSNTIVSNIKYCDDSKELEQELIQFGDDFNFKVFVISREEQLEELQKKRESVLYLGSPYKCDKCAKGFRSEITHRNHMKCHQFAYGMFECGLCHTRHKSDSRRRRHADTHRLRYCCTRCEFVARSRDVAESHFEWHSGKTYACRFCGETFGKLATQLSHVRLRHPGECAACELCGEAFVGALGLQIHQTRVHGGVSKPEKEREECAELFCYTCRVQFRSREGFARHGALARAGGACGRGRPCVECGEDFTSDEALLEHRRLFHAEPPIKCQKCDAVFANATSRQTHYERVHLHVRVKKREGPIVAARVRSAAIPSPLEKKAIMCEVCGNKFHSPAALTYHQRAHAVERPFKCPRCPKTFPFKHSLQAHLRIHTGERPFRCGACPRAFLNANNLSRHKRTIHGGFSSSRCATCLQWLCSPAAARRHAALHRAQRIA